MKFTTTAATATAVLAASAAAQNMSMPNATDASSNYTTGLLAALNGAGLTTLAGVLGGYPQLAMGLMQGNFSVFAPNNDALAALLGSGTNFTDDDIMNVLMYHITPAYVDVAMLGDGTNHTIVPSLLSAPLLGPNQTFPLVASIGADGDARIRTAAQNVTVGANVTYENLLVHVVDQVITAPRNLTETLELAGLAQLSGALGAVASVLPTAALENAARLTIFAPNDAAFANISQVIGTLQPAQRATVLGNHVINGTVVYSTGIVANPNITAVSAMGETFSFRIENGTVYVMSGNATMARVVRTDIPIQNGVVHVIDSVLANTNMNAEVAASAASVAATALPTSGIGAAAGGSGTGAGATGAGFKVAAGLSTVAAVMVAAGIAIIA